MRTEKLTAVKILVASFCAMLAVCLGLLVGVHLIPSRCLYPHASSSLTALDGEGLKYKVAGFPLFRLDNFTDALMVSVAVSAGGDDPLHAALQNSYAVQDDRMSVVEATQDWMAGRREGVTQIPYARYWHGYLVVLRPLLLATDWSGIRVVNCICFAVLLCCLCIVLRRCGSRRLFWCFLASAAAVNIGLVPLSMQFSSVFYIAFSAMIYLLIYKDRMRATHRMLPFFMVTGGLTAFFDLLTTPLVTLCLPLIVYLSEVRTAGRRAALFGACAGWGAGYALMWAGKWLLAGWLTGFDIAGDALQQVMVRTSTEYDGFDMSLAGIGSFALRQAAARPWLAVAALAVAVAFAAFTLWCRRTHRQRFRDNSWLLIVAAMPVAWCLLVRNHSVIHYWFVWRVFVVTIFALLLFFVSVLSGDRDGSPEVRKE